MATLGTFSGDLLATFVDGVKIGHSTDSTLTISQSLPDATTKDSGQYEETIHGNRPWTATAAGLVVYGSAMGAEELYNYINGQLNVNIEFKTDDVDDIVYSGIADVESLTMNAAQNSVVSFDVTFKGDGPISLSGGLPSLIAPANFTATPNSDTQITLTWDAVVDATSYTLSREGSPIYTGGLLTFADTGLTASTLYNYTVIATAPGYNNSPASATSGTTDPVPASGIFDLTFDTTFN